MTDGFAAEGQSAEEEGTPALAVEIEACPRCAMTEAAGTALAYSLALGGAMDSYEMLASVAMSASEALKEAHDKLMAAEELLADAGAAEPRGGRV